MHQAKRRVLIQKSFHEELKQVFRYFPKYHMKFVLGDFNAIMEREDIFEPKIGK